MDSLQLKFITKLPTVRISRALFALSLSHNARIAPSLQRKNLSAICVPAFNIYCRTGSNSRYKANANPGKGFAPAFITVKWTTFD